MKNFYVELRFTGITMTKATEIFKKMEPLLRETENWQITGDCDTCKVMMHDGEWWWSPTKLRAPEEQDKYQYAVKMVAPLYGARDILGLAEMRKTANEMFAAGAVVSSTDCVRVHLLSGYSERTAQKILKELLHGNKLLYTALFFPNLMAPVCLPARCRFDESDDQFKDLRAEIYKNYRPIIEGIVAGGEKWLAEKMLYELMRDKLHPRFNEIDCTRPQGTGL